MPAVSSIEEAINAADALFVATPTSTHHKVAMQAIAANRHVFVEKPLAHTSRYAAALVEASRRVGTKLAVGHTERFNPVVRWLLERLRGKEILSLNIERVGPRPPRIKDVGIVTDLGVHDLDLFECLTGSELKLVRCIGRATSGSQEDIAQILVCTRSGVVGFHQHKLAYSVQVAPDPGRHRGSFLQGRPTPIVCRGVCSLGSRFLPILGRGRRHSWFGTAASPGDRICSIRWRGVRHWCSHR